MVTSVKAKNGKNQAYSFKLQVVPHFQIYLTHLLIIVIYHYSRYFPVNASNQLTEVV